MTREEAIKRVEDYTDHSERCEFFLCANCGHWMDSPEQHDSYSPCPNFESKPCTCGLDDVLAALASIPEIADLGGS